MHPISVLAPKFASCIFFSVIVLANPAMADIYDDVSLQIKNGNFTQAELQINKHLSAKPADPQMRFLKGVAQRATGQTDAALVTFLTLTQDYPELAEPHNNLAAIYASRNEFDKARLALEQAVRANPEYALAHENLGDIFAKLASLSYAKAAKFEPFATRAPAKIASINLMLGGNASTGNTVLASPPATAASR